MELHTHTFLQGGKYRIEKVLGQGGFGITYLGTQVALNRKVAIKEFFMKEYCNRDEATSRVSVPSEGSKELVAKFKTKFIKEAQTIAEMDNQHIIRIHDVFEENGTAYYVMEYLQGGDLSHKISSKGIPETEALEYIRQIGDALTYIHSKNILHLDIKPTNILFRENGDVVLIDFGVSKHYDDTSGSQTSSTPVGISEGYAPTEQYDREAIASFAPSTDVYSLGATLYCLLCGIRPPKASVVLNEGLPALPSKVSDSTRIAVEKAMAPRRKDRPQSVKEFLALLDDEVTIIPISRPREKAFKTFLSFMSKRTFYVIACVIAVLTIILSLKEETSISSPTGTINGHSYVDLGLSVKWADCNIGASSPSDYGAYFAWAETTPKIEYTEENYKIKGIHEISGNPQYDAASYNWKSTWRLPTDDEFLELKHKCKWKWTTKDGHKGYKVTGPNGNSIFLPAAGYYKQEIRKIGELGYYWENHSLDRAGFIRDASSYSISDNGHGSDITNKFWGQSIRPVSK